MAHRIMRGVGETFITIGIVILLFCGYELWFTGLETAREQRRLEEDLTDLWSNGGGRYNEAFADIPLGSGVAILRIPAFGRGWAKVVVEGVTVADLKKGPGHYPKTQLPGQVGNFVISGHRTTYGAPFNRIDELKPGHAIVVETADMYYTYRMTKQEIVGPGAIEVTYPVPYEKKAVPSEALMTLTSCNPKYSARQRIIVFSKLESKSLKSAGMPPALYE